MNGRGLGLPVGSWWGALARADGLGTDVADVRIVGDSAGGGAGHADFVLSARKQAFANALCVGTLVGSLPTWKRDLHY